MHLKCVPQNRALLDAQLIQSPPDYRGRGFGIWDGPAGESLIHRRDARNLPTQQKTFASKRDPAVALAGSSPLRQWRERGRWPESFDRLWQSLQERHGKHAGTREMVELLTLGKRYGWDRLQREVEQALALGCTDAAAVRHLLTATELSRPRHELLVLNGLERYERPLPQMNEYDQLLGSPAEVAR